MGLFDIFRKKKTDEKNEATQDNLEQADEQQNVQEQASITDDTDVSEVTDGTDIVSTTSEEETVDDTVVSDDTATSDENITNETIVADETIVTTAPTIDTDDADVSEVADKADIVSTTSDDEAHTSTDEQAIYNKGLTKSRGGFAERFNRFLANFRTVDEDFFDDLEETLIGSDVGFDMVIRISDELREEVKLKNAKRKEDVSDVIIKKLVDIYEEEGSGEDNQMHFAPTGQPTIIMFVGVNGVGKTTTIGKLASQYQKAGKRVLLAAADTFRAGATKQLQEWG
ncbi:MAG: signal recognition particle receptor subunit alpha, partial [Leuconostoc fallax]